MNKMPLLVDFDGVLKLGKKPANDAGTFFNFLSENKIPSYIISNSTLRTSTDIIKFFAENNIECNIPAMTAADAALNYVKQNYKHVSVYCIDSIKKIFNDFIDDENPEAVVIGDNGENWNYQIMNEIFRKVNAGADLIAMQKNRYWHPDGKELSLDAGAFIKAIEYGANREAILIGKPSPIYFNSALNLLGFTTRDEFYMIGDDIENDVNAAQDIGGRGVLIYTGKTKRSDNSKFKIKPDLEIDSLTEMIEFIEKKFT